MRKKTEIKGSYLIGDLYLCSSFLNVDLKILSKCLSEKLKEFLSSLIEISYKQGDLKKANVPKKINFHGKGENILTIVLS